MSEKQDLILNLTDKANRDLKAAEVLLKDEDADFHSGNICFHCQQSIEKYLKVFLISKDALAPKTHDLLFLTELCSDFDEHFKSFDFTDFASFGVEIRYDNDIPTLDEAKKAVEVAKLVAEYIMTLTLYEEVPNDENTNS
ncbi:MAG: HEPN domain-containing protein [Oscillospiraceae bacterium]|nr:HEPN domain-containing protein [Oscillospiraceae bacterium]